MEKLTQTCGCPEIILDSEASVSGLTINALMKNMEGIGEYLEVHLPDFEDLRFSIDCAWTPEFRDLANPKVCLTVYTFRQWCQITLREARVLDPAYVLSLFKEHCEARFGDRSKSKGKYNENKQAEPKQKVSLSLDELFS